MAKLNVSGWTWLLGLPTTSRFGWKHTLDTHKRFSKDFNPHSAARINNISVEVGQCWSLGNEKHFKICLLLNRYCSIMEAVDLCWPHFCAPLSLLSIFFSVLKSFIICQNNPDRTAAHMSDSKPFRANDLLCTPPVPAMVAKWWTEQSVQGPDGVLSATVQNSHLSVAMKRAALKGDENNNDAPGTGPQTISEGVCSRS